VLANDARSLSPSAQAALRKRAVKAHVEDGMKQCDVAKAFHVSAEIVCKWVRAYRTGGEAALEGKSRGRKRQSGCLLTDVQAAAIRKLIIDHCPEQLKLPFALWTRDAVRDLIYRKYKIKPSVRTVGNYLWAWGFTAQKPVRRAYERDESAVQEWLDAEYPNIARRAKQDKARIYWSDEMGLRSDHLVGRSYSPRGVTPVVATTGKRFSCSMISAVTNQGHLCFRVFDGSFTVKVFIDFLGRLIKQAGQKVFLIVDGHPVHRAKLVQKWREAHKDKMEIFYLPSYSPQLNPDELLNQDVKANVFSAARPANLGDMKASLRSYLFSTQKKPNIVRSFFQEENVAYALPEAV
jgi:transposase